MPWKDQAFQGKHTGRSDGRVQSLSLRQTKKYKVRRRERSDGSTKGAAQEDPEEKSNDP